MKKQLSIYMLGFVFFLSLCACGTRSCDASLTNGKLLFLKKGLSAEETCYSKGYNILGRGMDLFVSEADTFIYMGETEEGLIEVCHRYYKAKCVLPKENLSLSPKEYIPCCD